MSDLVERLREGVLDVFQPVPLALEAADEIVRLTAEVKRLGEQNEGLDLRVRFQSRDIARLQAVVDAAREALHLDASLLDRMIAIRRALDGEP